MSNLIEIHDGLEPRYLMPPHFQFAGVVAASMGVFGDTAGSPDLLTDAELKPGGISKFAPAIKDQNGVGACNPFATVTTMELAGRVAGMDYYPTLSPGDLYRRVSGGRDQGSILEDAIREALKGVASIKTMPAMEWRRNNAEADAERPMYAVQEWWNLPTVRHMMSAILRGFACNLGMMWGGSDNIDGDGWLPNSVRGRAGGHAICRDSVVVRNGKFGLDGPNSWSERWGANGRMVIPAERLQREENEFGWFAVRTVLYVPGSQPLP